MKIQISLTVKQAKAIRDLLREKYGDAADMAGALFQLDSDLEDHEKEQQAKGPWRAVVGYKSALHGGVETLECGHGHHLRWTRHWVEDRAKRRRCPRCADAGEK